VLEEIGLDNVKLKGYGFQIEMKFRAFKKGFKIVEVPIIFTNRILGESKMNGGIIHEAVFGVLNLKWKSSSTDYEKADLHFRSDVSVFMRRLYR
jgi:dolichol-phosphate mannosyltransferase